MAFKKKMFRRRRKRRGRRAKNQSARSKINIVTIRGPLAIADQYNCRMTALKSEQQKYYHKT